MPLTNTEIGIAFKVARDLGWTAAWTPEGGIIQQRSSWRDPEPEPREPKQPGHVYFVRAPSSEAIKIGYSTDPLARFANLQTGSPELLLFYGSIPGTRADERALHEKFFHLRINGEWFHACDELFNHIDNQADEFEERPQRPEP